jgi:hypothetical protein
MRRDERIRTDDVTATVFGGVPRLAGEVRNLGDHGFLLEGVDLPPGTRCTFELRGPSWAYTGHGRVAHVTDGAVGLRVERWDGDAGRAVHARVASVAL